MRKIISILLFASVMLFSAGCAHTNKWYVDAAVREAREFLLKSDAPALTTAQKEFIRFAAPTVLTKPVLGGIPYAVHQSCITWVIPDYPFAIMVCGYGDDNFSNWTPNRILLRELSVPNPDLDKAVAAARARVLVDLFDFMSTADYNHVRFANAEIYRTAFVLADESVASGEEETEEDAAPVEEEAAESAAPVEEAVETNTIQYSIVWRLSADPSGRDLCAVACGMGGEKMKDWSVSFCTVMDADELEGCRIVSEPAEISIGDDGWAGVSREVQ